MRESLDLVVVGAGPCGIAAGVAGERAGLGVLLFDKGAITESLLGYPYYMTFFSTAKKLEIGNIPFTIPESKPTRRQALAYYRRVVEHYQLRVRQNEEVVGISGEEGAFVVRTRRRNGPETEVAARAVVVATGGFHEPNRLGCPGDGLPKVHHWYREPYPYYDQDVVVVGGGNSAVEATLELFRNGARPTLVHFAEDLDPGVKPWVVPDIRNRLDKGEVPVYWRHRVAEITPDQVRLRHEVTREDVVLPNDFVLAMTGWRADPTLLRAVGVEVDGTTGIPAHHSETMETNVPGIYIAGVLAAGHDANKVFIENGRFHGERIVEALKVKALV